ncbi:MAG: imidazole glycerol phosphate synthase subunit HisH [Eubacteriaceae bacterium]|nr:imidazole glycerol phosphate synthase subunit HisH [Eubacteriaceae bacterium]
MIGIIDYGVGNLFSLESSLKYIGAETVITSDPKLIEKCDRIILPGVGAFGDAIDKLRGTGLDKVVIEEAGRGKPLMGICLGMQILFEKGYEYGVHQGLGLLKGDVVSMEGRIPYELNIPHMGWNSLNICGENTLLKNTKDGDCVYFVHSYYVTDCSDSLIATSDYGIPITAAVQKGNVMGCQFHPEKSGKIGLDILKAFQEV